MIFFNLRYGMYLVCVFLKLQIILENGICFSAFFKVFSQIAVRDYTDKIIDTIK